MKKILLACLCFGLLSQVVEGSDSTSSNSFAPFRPDSEHSLTTESVHHPEGASSSSSSLSDASSSAVSTAQRDMLQYKLLLGFYLKENDSAKKGVFKSIISSMLENTAEDDETIYKKILSSWLTESEEKHIQQYESLFYAWVNMPDESEQLAELLMSQWSSEADWEKKSTHVSYMLQLGNLKDSCDMPKATADAGKEELTVLEKTERELRKGGKKLEHMGQNIGRMFGRHRHTD